MTLILGPLPCKACGRAVKVDRIGSHVRIMDGQTEHTCPPVRVQEPVRVPLLEVPAPNICGAWMRNVEERCARGKGHASSIRDGGHRRRTVMDDERDRRRGNRAA